MKHLIASEHHPHLKKRALLEAFGLVLLIGFSVSQSHVIVEALHTISSSNIFYVAAALLSYWIFLPLTAISYTLLTKKEIPLWSTALAQAAGSGPGRIIPGGLGHVSVSIMHLKKLGVSTPKAVVVSITNNLIGLSINLIVIGLLVLLNPSVGFNFITNIDGNSLLIIGMLLLMIFALIEWLIHARRTRNSIKRVNREWKSQISLLTHHPKRLSELILVALLILGGNIALLLLCSQALDLHVSITHAIISLSSGAFIGGILPTPGGLGGAEAGLASAMIILGYSPAEATGVALLYRTVTYWQPLIPGTLAYLYLREKRLL